MRESLDRSLDPELWHACAGGMVQIPPVNSEVFYFPQGHAEHTLMYVDFGKLPKIPAMILCRVEDVKYLADPETDEVYCKIRLVPGGNNEMGFEEERLVKPVPGSREKPTSFAKTLTQSDANNGGGFSVPRYCAETIFPRLDYTADPPVQNIVARDVHGETWKFRHIYRGTPRRHLLTTGWSTFVNQKKLVAGDSIVFMRAENGNLWVGIRRAKKISNSGDYGGFSSSFLKVDTSKLVKPESVLQVSYLAANGQPFEVEFLPRVNTPEFCVRSSSVYDAMRIQWWPGIRFKMPFETEDSSRISWFMGTVASVQVNDPHHWCNSPWRLLQVTWDESDLLQNVKCVNPWLVEIVSGMPVSSFTPLLPPRKKLCSPHDSDFSFDFQFPMPIGPKSHSFVLQDTISAGIQGARHASSLNELQMGLSPSSFFHLDHQPKVHDEPCENVSCISSIGSSSQKLQKTNNMKTVRFVLFGQSILTEQHMPGNDSGSSVEHGKSSSSEALSYTRDSGELTKSLAASERDRFGLDAAIHCKVFIDSEDIARSLDLSIIQSFKELYQKLEEIVGSDVQGNVLYHDATGAIKPIEDEPETFSNFVKKVERLIIHTKQHVHDTGRKLISDLAVGASGNSALQTRQAFEHFG